MTTLQGRVVAIMGAVRNICYGKSVRIPKVDKAWLRKKLREYGFSLDEVKEMEKEFYANM